jgi:hypothetical protein
VVLRLGPIPESSAINTAVAASGRQAPFAGPLERDTAGLLREAESRNLGGIP